MTGMGVIAHEAGLNPVTDPVTRRKIFTTSVLNRFFRLIVERCARGETVSIANFGSFAPRLYKGRTIYTPILPGGEATFPDVLNIRFSISKNARATLNQLAHESKEKTKTKRRKKADRKMEPKVVEAEVASTEGDLVDDVGEVVDDDDLFEPFGDDELEGEDQDTEDDELFDDTDDDEPLQDEGDDDSVTSTPVDDLVDETDDDGDDDEAIRAIVRKRKKKTKKKS